MSWGTVLVICGGAYAFKVLGLVVFGGRQLSARAHAALDLLPAALLAAIVVQGTFTTKHALVIDARAAGVAAAAVALWRRAPFALVIVIAAAVTAGVRQLA